ncbi:MAG TPA: hypothetical protein VK730_13760 [Solirubrobacteraceae bacterium]|jgi:hypothetical protein|nr:hypothetical protein [Solirubrobacteraceae bacterium]
MRYDIAIPEVGLALAEIVALKLQRESPSAPALSAADVLSRERPNSLRARALERALCDLAKAHGWVDLPLSHQELLVAAKELARVTCEELADAQSRLDGAAELESRALQRRAEGATLLLMEFRGDNPVIRRAA